MKIRSFFSSLLSFWPFSTFAKKSKVYNNKHGAIKGYDPVSYFTESKPVKGKKDITYKWKDVNWYFTSETNRDIFIASPEAYAPQFGGYCSYAASEGYIAKIDPKAWKIVNGKLYLNYNLETKKEWEADLDERIKKAEANWPFIIDND